MKPDIKHYDSWFKRFERILSVYKQQKKHLDTPVDELFTPEVKEALQLFLLDMGHFNANFTEKELERLKYLELGYRSPFTIIKHNSYSRVDHTWAMQMLSNKYCQKELIPYRSKEKSFAIINSTDFSNQISISNKYKVIDATVDGFNLCELINELNTNKNLENKYLIEIKKEDFLRDAKTDEILNDIMEHVLSNLTPENALNVENVKKNMQQKLSFFYLDKYNDANEIIVSKDKELMNYMTNLGFKFEYIDLYAIFIDSAKFSDEISRYYKVINATVDDVNIDKFIHDLREGNETLSCKYFIKIKKEDMLNKIIGQYVPNTTSTLEKPTLDALQKLSFFYLDKYKDDHDVIVFQDKELITLMNHLGYRIDPVKAIRAILKDDQYENCFFDPNATKKFLSDFEECILNKARTEPNIAFKKINDILSLVTDTAENVIQFDYIKFYTIKKNEQYDEPFQLFAKLLYHYLDKYDENVFAINPCISLFIDITMPEINDEMERFINSARDKNISKGVRAVQAIIEIIQLEQGLIHANSEPYIDIIQKQLQSLCKQSHPHLNISNYIQQVAITPYAMRAFARVLQIIELDSRRRANIAVTNQGYFELLDNLDKLRAKSNSISQIRHVDDIESNVDIIFMELHPNNVAATSQQYAHNIFSLLNNIKYWNDDEEKRALPPMSRTLVLDVTLNALNDDETANILDSSAELVENGKLNLILIQSLTKFSQLGLDKRSAGCIILINNGATHWQDMNKKLKEITDTEPVDKSIENFFAYFAGHNDLLKRYIEMVNNNVKKVYELTMDKLNGLQIIQHSRFQITMSSDPKACYVAINMSGLLPDCEEESISMQTFSIVPQGCDGIKSAIRMMKNNIETIQAHIKTIQDDIILSSHDLSEELKKRNETWQMLTDVIPLSSNTLAKRLTTLVDTLSVQTRYIESYLKIPSIILANQLITEVKTLQKSIGNILKLFPNAQPKQQKKQMNTVSLSEQMNQLSEKATSIKSSLQLLSNTQSGQLTELINTFSMKTDDIEHFSRDLLNYLIYPLCEFHDLPISARTSIGFPLTSVNVVMDSLRFTIGLETDEQLQQYADILAYTAFVLNRVQAPQLFFVKNAKKEYKWRTEFLKEKNLQYQAMTPDKNILYEFDYVVEPFNNPLRNVKLENGAMSISDQYSNSETRVDCMNIIASTSLNTDIKFDDLPPEQKRFIAACLSGINGGKAVQTVPSSSNSITPNTLTLSSYAISNIQDAPGLKINSTVITDNIWIEFGSTELPMNQMLFAKRAVYLKIANKCHVLNLKIVRVTDNIKYIISLEKIVYKPGISVFGLEIVNNGDNKSSFFEVDYWSEKDPVLARFMRLMTMIFIKNNLQTVNFKAYDNCFALFVVNIDLKQARGLFEEAVAAVTDKKTNLKELLNQTHAPSSESYNFGNIRWPDGWSGVNYARNKTLIDKALKLASPAQEIEECSVSSCATTLFQDCATRKTGSFDDLNTDNVPKIQEAPEVLHLNHSNHLGAL